MVSSLRRFKPASPPDDDGGGAPLDHERCRPQGPHDAEPAAKPLEVVMQMGPTGLSNVCCFQGLLTNFFFSNAARAG
jgi:hypothetical protein